MEIKDTMHEIVGASMYEHTEVVFCLTDDRYEHCNSCGGNTRKKEYEEDDAIAIMGFLTGKIPCTTYNRVVELISEREGLVYRKPR